MIVSPKFVFDEHRLIDKGYNGSPGVLRLHNVWLRLTTMSLVSGGMDLTVIVDQIGLYHELRSCFSPSSNLLAPRLWSNQHENCLSSSPYSGQLPISLPVWARLDYHRSEMRRILADLESRSRRPYTRPQVTSMAAWHGILILVGCPQPQLLCRLLTHPSLPDTADT